MVQSKEVLSLKKQVRRLKAKLAAIKSKAVDDDSLELVRLRRVVSKLRAENNILKKKTDWYSDDLEGQFRRRLHAMRGDIEASM